MMKRELKNILIANKEILELFRANGGPVHINQATKMTEGFNTKNLPNVRSIRRYTLFDILPDIKFYNTIGIFVGSHKKFTKEETQFIECFCEKNNALVLCDHTSNYHGNYNFLNALLDSQEYLDRNKLIFDLIIDLGEVTGNYDLPTTKEFWRVSLDGKVKDRFGNLTDIFEMPEKSLFEYYSSKERKIENTLYKKYLGIDKSLRKKYKIFRFQIFGLRSK